MKTTITLALAMAATTSSDAFVVQPACRTSSSLAVSAPSYTGGTNGSRMVSVGRLNKDAPWGNENPNLLFDRSNYRTSYTTGAVPFGPKHDPPASTGGAGGSTFVSDYIEKDSMFPANYHLAQQYRSHLRMAKHGLPTREEIEYQQQYEAKQLSEATQRLGPLDPAASFSTIPKPLKAPVPIRRQEEVVQQQAVLQGA